MYAQCARTRPSLYAPQYSPGDMLILAINLDNTTSATVELTDSTNGGLISASPRDEYRFTGPLPPPLPGSDTNCFFSPGYGPKLPYMPSPICLNGELLYLIDGPAGPNSTLPSLQPNRVADGSPIVMPPLSVAMFILTESNASACIVQT